MCMHVKRIAVAIALSICVAGCGQGQKETPARPDRRGKRAKPVLLARRGLQDLRVLPDRLGLGLQRPVKARCGVMRSNCQAATCRAECNEDEVLIVAYCGPRRSAVTFVNERTVTCPRGARLQALS
jgi:hypothetical protein